MSETPDTLIKTKEECIHRLQQFINELQRDKITPRKAEVLTYSVSKLFFMLECEEKSNKTKDRK